MAAQSKTRLIVHMGVQKTGTTSLQHFLRRNRDDLGLNVLVPAAGSPCRRLGRTAWLYSQDLAPLDEFVAVIHEVRDAVLESGASLSLLSHENLCGALPGTGDVLALFPRLPEITALLVKHLAPLDVDFVFYTRDLTRWKASVHNQVIKSDSYPHDWARFDADTQEAGDWVDVHARLSAEIGADRVTFLPLEGEVDRGRPGTQLLAHAGLSAAQIAALDPISGSRNESLTPGALEFMRLANGLKLSRPTRRELAKTVIQNQPVFDTLSDVLTSRRKES